MASSLAKEAGDASTAGFHRICSNRRSGENKHSDGELLTKGRVFSKELIYHRCRQEDEQELLCM